MLDRRQRVFNDNQTTRDETGGVSRRVLLTGIGAGGLSAAIAAAGAGSEKADDPPTVSDRQPVYRETEHIRQFYARSRF